MLTEEQRHRILTEIEALKAAGEGLPPDPEGFYRMVLLEQRLRGAESCEDLCCRRWQAERN